MDSFWTYKILGNLVKDWFIAIGIMVVAIAVLRLLQGFLVNRIGALVAKTKTSIDDFLFAVMRSSVMPLVYILVVHFALQYLSFSSSWQKVEHVAIMVIVTFFVLRAITAFIKYSFQKAVKGHEHTELREKQSRGILLIIQIILWLGGILFLIDNLGYDITTLVAGLGIGGIAIALAAQTILGDLFSYLVIFFDKPFEIGDFIIIDDKMGTVEYIGIKTTRLRTLGGEQLICSNTDLTNSRVHNYKRMQERRIVFGFGVVYSTSAQKLKVIPQTVRHIIESMDDTRFDRAHFKGFGDFSLDFEVVFYVLSPDYNKYMDIQQQINLKLFEIFEKEQVEFAFPTQTVFVSKVGQEESFTQQ